MNFRKYGWRERLAEARLLWDKPKVPVAPAAPPYPYIVPPAPPAPYWPVPPAPAYPTQSAPIVPPAPPAPYWPVPPAPAYPYNVPQVPQAPPYPYNVPVAPPAPYYPVPQAPPYPYVRDSDPYAVPAHVVPVNQMSQAILNRGAAMNRYADDEDDAFDMEFDAGYQDHSGAPDHLQGAMVSNIQQVVDPQLRVDIFDQLRAGVTLKPVQYREIIDDPYGDVSNNDLLSNFVYSKTESIRHRQQRAGRNAKEVDEDEWG